MGRKRSPLSVFRALDVVASQLEGAAFPGRQHTQDIDDGDVKVGQNACRIELDVGDIQIEIDHEREQPTFRKPERLLEGAKPPLVIVLNIT